MLDKIIKFSIQHKLIIGLFTLGLIAWGIYSINRLPIDAVPDITNNQVQIITSSPSNGATDIERFVTFPIEQTMSTIPGKEEIRSFSRFGLSVVTVIFKDNIDVYWARQQVSERLTEAKTEIPDGMGNPELGPVSTGLGEIYQYIVRPKPGYEKKYSDRELRSIQDWVIRRQLLGVPGVADVSSFGGHLKQYEVALNPDKLRAIDVSISDIFNALARNNQNTGGAYIDKKPNAYFIRSDGLIKDLDDIRNIVVKNTPGGTPILIKDVGTVQYGSAIRYGAMTYNNEGETVGALVLMLKGANASKVIKDVKARIAQISKTLPQGVEIHPFLDRSKLVNRAISTVTRNLAEGALIVIFVLVLFLGNLRAGLIVASVIPLSMLFAISLMNVFGVSGNLMSLGAIDFGLIVDGAVIIVETVLHQLAVRKKPGMLAQSVMDHEVHYSANKMMSSATFGQVIILIVYFPILALTGIEGKMFRPMAETVAFAIIGALILSLTYVPMMSALFLSKKIKHKRTFSDRIMEVFQKAYTPLIHLALKRRIMTILIALVLFIGSLVTFNYLGAEFIPSLDEGDFAIEMRVMTGSSLSQTIEASQKAAKVLKDNFPEVKEVVGKIGSSEIPTDPMPVEAADIMVILKDKKDWTSASNKDELAEKMQAKLEENVPGVTFGFQQPIQMRFNELISGAKQDLVVKVFGDDLDMLAKYAEQIGGIARTVKGSADVYVEQVTGLPQIVIHYNRSQIARFGLNIEDINRVVQAGFAGTSAGLVFEGERRYDLVIRLEKENRQSIEDIKNLSVTTPAGVQVPISQLADVQMELGPNQIQREDTRRRIIVGINVRGRDVNSLVQELQQKIDGKIKFAPGYSLSYGGAFKNLQEATARLSIAVPVALLLIFFLLFISFNSFKQALLIFTAIPLSAIGGVFALWIRGMPFSISAGIGFIALFGVAVLNGIVLIAEFNSLKKSGITNLREIVIMGTRVRLRPVLMTATVASLGFLPMALSHGSGAEVQKPLATVVIGGLITATFLTLFVLPVLYTYFEGIKWKKMKTGATITVQLVLMLSPFLANAQTQQTPVPQTLDMLIQKAVDQNALVQSATLDISKQEFIRKTATDFGKTDFGGQYGQSNSRRWDTYFSVNQNIPNPGLFGARKKLADARIEESKLNVNVVKNDLIYNVRSAYYRLNYLLAYRQLLYEQDTVYQNFLKAANLRYKTGESTLLEAKTAETQLNEIRNIASKNNGDILIVQNQLQTLLNTAEPIAIADSMITKADISSILHRVDSSNNPVLKLIKQQIEIANRGIKVKRAEAGPDFSVGYFNQSIIGIQPVNGQEVHFGSGDRFWGVQAGISIPLFYRPYKNKIKAAKVDAQIAQKEFELFSTNIQGKYEQAISEYLKQEKSVHYYEASALPNAEFLRRQAQEAFRQGEIQYVELLQALSMYSEIRSNYLQTVHQFNQSVIELQYLYGQNN